MTRIARRLFAIGAFALAIARAGAACAEDGAKPKPAASAPDKVAESEIARFCANLAPSAAEARVAYQTRRLIELQTELKQRIADLEKREAETREWVAKREALLKAASEDVVAIYAKMDADAAAVQIGAMDDSVAAAVLVKLKPGAASAILGGMDAARAAKLTSLMTGLAGEDKKS